MNKTELENLRTLLRKFNKEHSFAPIHYKNIEILTKWINNILKSK